MPVAADKHPDGGPSQGSAAEPGAERTERHEADQRDDHGEDQPNRCRRNRDDDDGQHRAEHEAEGGPERSLDWVGQGRGSMPNSSRACTASRSDHDSSAATR